MGALGWTQNESKTTVPNVAGSHQSHAVAAFPVGKQWDWLRTHVAPGAWLQGLRGEVGAVGHTGRRLGIARPSVGRSEQVN